MGRKILRGASLLAGLTLGTGTGGQQIPLPSDAELAAITERGRALADYDQAVWHATDALQMANPKTAEGQHCLARREKDKWTVVFGSLNPDKTKFLVVYQATERDPRGFAVTRNDPPLADTSFYFFSARALENSLADFGRPSRPYNAAILPAPEQQFYVYLYPAQTKAGVYPLGGDARYLVSAEGTKILEKRRLHQTIVETKAARKGKVVAGFHTHVLSDLPEDTDVFHVLEQSPPLPETVSTPHFTYGIASDGTIRIEKQRNLGSSLVSNGSFAFAARKGRWPRRNNPWPR